MRRTHRAPDEGFGLIEVVLAIAILGMVSIVLLPILITGLQVAGNQSTKASATRLLNDTIEQVRLIADDPTIACADVEITNALTDGRGVALEATTTVIENTHTGPEDASGNPTIVGSDDCTDFAAPGSLTLRIAVVRTDTGDEIARATTILSVLTPPEVTP